MNRSIRRGSWISAAVIAASLAGLLARTWLRWGDLLVDTGRELYVPSAILGGQVLYKDIFYLYGPFAPYLNAFFQAVCGEGVHGVVLGGILATAAACFLLHRLARIWLPELYAAWTALTFLFVFAFGNYLYHGIYNFILPYSSSATYGLVAALAALLSFHRLLSGGGRGFLLLTAIFTGITFLNRIEMGLSLWLSLGSAIFLGHRRAPEERRGGFANFMKVSLLAAAAVLLVYAAFMVPAWQRLMESSFLGTMQEMASPGRKLASILFGFDRLDESLAILRESFLVHLALVLLITCGGLLFERLGRAGQPALRRSVIAAGGVSLLVVAAISAGCFRWGLQYSLLPFMALSVLAVAVAGCIRGGPEERAKNLSLTALSLFSFLMTGRMLLQSWPGHYGFYLLVPGMLVAQILFFRILPDLLKGSAARSFMRTGFLLVFAVLLVAHVNVWREFYDSRTLEVASTSGRLRFHDDPVNRNLGEMILFLQREARPGDALVVFPEGLTINVLAGLPNPLYSYLYLPMDIGNERRERGVIAELESTRATYVAVVARPLEEYGSEGFGVDYGLGIMAYLPTRYDVVRRFGEGAVLLKRRG